MGILNKLKSFVSDGDHRDHEAGWRDSSWGSLGSVADIAAAKSIKGWVWVAIDTIASAAEGATWTIKNKKGEILLDHPVAKIMQRPNEIMSGGELMYLIASHLEAYQNFYARINKNIKPFEPGKVSSKFDSDSFEFEYKYNFNKLDSEDIWHVRYPSIYGISRNQSPIQYIQEWIVAENESNKYIQQILHNGVFLAGVFETELDGKDLRDKIKRSVEKDHQGPEKAGGILYPPAGAKFKPHQIDLSKIQYPEMDRQHRDKILAAFGVPKRIIGISESGDSKSDALAAERDFALHTMQPKLRRIANSINDFLIPMLTTDEVHIEFDNLSPEDVAEKQAYFTTALGGAPWMSRDEVRKAEGLEGSENGDEILVPANLLPGGKVDKQVSAELGRKESLGEVIKKSLENVKLPEKKKDLVTTYLESLSEGEIVRRQIGDVLHKNFVNRNSSFEENIKQIIITQIEEIKTITLDSLDSYVAEQTKSQSFIPDPVFDTFVAQTVEAVAPLIRQLMITEYAQVNQETTLPDLSPSSDYVVRSEAITRQTSMPFADTYFSQIAKVVNQAILDGDEMAIITEKLLQFFGNDESKAQTFARSITFTAANQARRDNYRDSGVVKTVKYHTAGDELVCSFCRSLDGNVVSVDEGFFQNGDTISSEEGTLEVIMSGTDAPVHPSCRCFTLPEDISIIN